MPRLSLRRRAIDGLIKKIKKLQLEATIREIMCEEDLDEDDRLIRQKSILKKVMEKRYLFHSSKNRTNRKKFDLDDTLSYDSKHFNDDEFVLAFRITRDSFFLLLNEMKDKDAFIIKNNKCHQRPISFQLLVFLYRVGQEGTGAGYGYISLFFGIAKGSVQNYVRRCVRALLEIKDEVVYWPDANEQLDMRKRLMAYGFRHCVGIIDGTLVFLDFRPESFHECYFSRKSMYALNVMIVCDDQKRIIYYTAGWPGSTHDNRVFQNCNLFLNGGEFFSPHEYLLGDSAYSSSAIMVQSFKKEASHAELEANKEFFNSCLAQIRISSEHCIGMLKGRFRCMKKCNIRLKKTTEEVKELVNLIGACVTMHNLLINYDETEIPKSWYDNLESEIDWSMYDKEEDEIAHVTDENEDRRKYVFNSLINNYR